MDAPWIPRSPAGFNFNGDGSSDRRPQILAPHTRPTFNVWCRAEDIPEGDAGSGAAVQEWLASRRRARQRGNWMGVWFAAEMNDED